MALVERYLSGAHLTIDLVLCSPARRTRETWDGIRNGLSGAPEVRFVPEVYEATAGELVDVLRQVDNHHTSVLLIGHNPGMAELADELIGDGRRKALDRLAEGFPTGALATLTVDRAWSDLDRHTARLESYLRPRDLAD